MVRHQGPGEILSDSILAKLNLLKFQTARPWRNIVRLDLGMTRSWKKILRHQVLKDFYLTPSEEIIILVKYG